jgi:glucose-6-phosphate dehydrogenase assembly protein OpcA
MPATDQLTNMGMPVELEKIESELKKLWQQSEGTAARASLVNLAVYSEERDSLPHNTAIIAKITEDHACRAIVISANRAAKENRIEAWISAHCHITGAGNKQVCSEQISFALEGPCLRLLPSIVFPHLDSDLPFYLWWQGEFQDPIDAQLFTWVDRLIYDSQTWRDFDAQMRLVESAQKEAKERVILCDLNWTRLVPLRLALAQFFDHPASHHHFLKIHRAEIDFAPGYRSTATLLAGWIAAQLNWELEGRPTSGPLQFRNGTAGTAEVELTEKEGAAIGRCSLHSKEKEFCVARMAGADLLEVSSGPPGKKCTGQLMPAGDDDPVALLSEELMRGGPRRVYLRVLECVRDLF